MTGAEGVGQHSVRMQRVEHGWDVYIMDPEGDVVSTRACGSETEARTFVSTVRQHLYWLSPEKFREYYRIDDPALASGGPD
ncbi:hypothetical protein BH20ACT24_BH20ACT24_02110 [soil metagenome]|nr:hypothetical protein [Actinomycetota bacterium]